MPTPQATTVPLHPPSSWDLGEANAEHPGFSQTSANLPDPDKLWQDFFNGVLRGDTDGYSGETVTTKTFSDSSPTGEAPPRIDAYEIHDGNIAAGSDGGAPDGGFVPTVASPGEGNGTSAAALEGLGGLLVTKLIAIGSNADENGSNISPVQGSACQTNQDSAQTGTSPNYTMGTYGWSDGVSPKPGSS